jgi:hypothetical protein
MSIIPVANALRNPGTIIDNVYMSESSLVQSAARVLNKETYQYPFNSTQLSSTQTLVVQKNLMATHVLGVFEFDPSNIPAGWYLDQGWGFILARRLQLQYGGSEILEIDYHDNFMRSMNECEDDRKKSSVIQNGGQFCTIGTINTPSTYTGAVPSSTGSGNLVFRAVIPLILPHSSVNSLRQLPFDVSCLNQSVNIRLSLADASSMWQWPNANGETAAPALVTNQQQLSYAQFIVGQQILIDTIASKKDLVSGMGPNSNYQLNYFWKYPQHFEAAFTRPAIADNTVTGSTTTQNGAVSVVLNSFRNAALDSIVLWVERVSPFNSARTVGQATNAKSPPASTGLNIIPMSNITLSYAGTQIYRSQSQELSQSLDYMINETDSTYEYFPAVRTALNTASAQSSNRQPYVRIQIAQFSETLFGGTAAGAMIQAAGGLLSNDTLQLSFDITDYFGVAAVGGAPTVINYRLNMQMLYQSSVVIERGTARFGFTNPMGQPQLNFSNM